jgi:hypothetical protein
MAAQWKQQRNALLAQGRQWLPEAERTALEETEANIDSLGARLRRLHDKQGGLHLHCPPATASIAQVPEAGKTAHA